MTPKQSYVLESLISYFMFSGKLQVVNTKTEISIVTLVDCNMIPKAGVSQLFSNPKKL